MIRLVKGSKYQSEIAQNQYVSFNEQLPLTSSTGQVFGGFNLPCGVCGHTMSHHNMIGQIREVIPEVFLISGGFSCSHCSQSHLFEFRVRASEMSGVSIEFVRPDGGLIKLKRKKQSGFVRRVWLRLKSLLSKFTKGP